MNKEDIEKIINIEINRSFEQNLSFIEKIKGNIIPFYKKSFLNPNSEEQEIYWVVYDECKGDSKSGYLIFYSEEENEFGLGTKTNKKNMPEVGTFIGIYGTFFETIHSM